MGAEQSLHLQEENTTEYDFLGATAWKALTLGDCDLPGKDLIANVGIKRLEFIYPCLIQHSFAF